MNPADSNIDEYESSNEILVTGTNDENDENDDLTNMTSTQIDGIPHDVVISLESLQEKLKGNINYTSWNIYIRNTLRSGGLRSFIDSSIPRLIPTDQQFTLWQRVSRKIGWWIIRQLDVSLVEKLDLSPTPVEFADETSKSTML
jgi:hypothetical protein